MNKLYFVPAALAILLVGCSSGSVEKTALGLTATSIWSRIETAAAQTESAAAPTATPRATATLESTATLTPRPTILPSPTPVSLSPESLSEAEEYLQLYEQAIHEGRATACKDASADHCPGESMTYYDALLSLLRLPAYVAAIPLPATSDWDVLDVSNPELERTLEESVSQGNYPQEVWCRDSDDYVCPNKLLDRETGTEWLQIVILGSAPPDPCKNSFIDTDSVWVESLVCPLGIHRIGLNDPREWGARDAMLKGDWDVLKEKLLSIAVGG